MLDEFFFAAVLVAGVLPDDFTFAVEDEGVGDVDDAHGAFEVGVLVEVDFVGPVVAFGVGFDAVGGAGVVDGDGDDFDAGFFLPFFVDFLDVVELAVAGLAPCGPEGYDDGAAVVLDDGGGDALSVDGAEGDVLRHGGVLGHEAGAHEEGGDEGEEDFFHDCFFLFSD